MTTETQPPKKMMVHMLNEPQGMSEERLADIKKMTTNLLTPKSFWSNATIEMINEIRRLQQRERDLLTAAKMWEENYNHMKSFVQDTCHIYAGDVV